MKEVTDVFNQEDDNFDLRSWAASQPLTPRQQAWKAAHPEFVTGTPEYAARMAQSAIKQAEWKREADIRQAIAVQRAEEARAALAQELREAHLTPVHLCVLQAPKLEQAQPCNKYVLLTRKADHSSYSLTRKEREYLAKYEARKLTSGPIYAKEFEVQTICKCGHTTLVHASKSDVRHKRWISMVEDICGSVCAACVERKYEDDAPIREAATQKAAEALALRVEAQKLLTSGEATSLLDAVEMVSADPQTQTEIYGATEGWWRQEQVSGISTTTGRERITAIDANIKQGYQLLQRRVRSH